jgi:hypothetical protein
VQQASALAAILVVPENQMLQSNVGAGTIQGS